MAEALLGTTLSPPELEAEYRDHFLLADRRPAGIIIGCLALVGPLFVLSDARFIANQEVQVWLASSRGLQLAIELALAWIILRSRRASTLDGAILAWAITSALYLVLQQSTRPRGYYLPVLDNVLGVMIVWTVFRSRFAVQLAGAVAFTASAMAWIVLFRDPPTRPEAMLIGTVLLLANGMGAYASLNSNRIRRLSFLDQRRVLDSEKRFRSIVDVSPNPIFTFRDGRVELVNRATLTATGRSREELVGRAGLDVLAPGCRQRLRERMEAVLAGGQVGVEQIQIEQKDGSIRTADAAMALCPDENGPVVQVVLTDTTERKAAEEALRESQGTLLLSQEIARIGTYVYDTQTDRWTGSATLDALFGIDERFPRRGSDWLELVHPGDRESMKLYLADVLARGSRFDHQYRVVDRRSGETRWVHGLGELQRGNGGEAVRLVGTIQDVTTRRLADIESDALRVKLALASRLAAMGTLVAGVAHEINNPLAANLADAGLALEVAREARQRLREGEPTDVEAHRRFLDAIIEALEDASEGGQRIAQIVKDLAAFASPAPKRVRLRLADVAATAIRWMPSALAQDVDIHVEIQDAPQVLASPGQVEQVVVNLLTNAAKATPSGRRGDVVVRIGPDEGGGSRLEVVDRGVGIDPTIRDRIFEPFFTTRRVGLGKGTGLGLAICHAIVTAHGGTLTVESEVGKGSTFRVELPAASNLPCLP
jgi:PAS domain S-box-containing protein